MSGCQQCDDTKKCHADANPGNGKCKICAGTGFHVYPEPCERCTGTGKCHVCDGSGKCQYC